MAGFRGLEAREGGEPHQQEQGQAGEWASVFHTWGMWPSGILVHNTAFDGVK
jgi:hypothetical protein